MALTTARTPIKTQELLAQISSFNTLKEFALKDEDRFSSIFVRIQRQIETATKCIESITTGINEVVKEDYKLEESGQNDHDQLSSKSTTEISKLKRVQQSSFTLDNALKDIQSELSKVSEYIHPDHQKVELFCKNMKEMENAVWSIPAEKQMVLDTLPMFLKEELDKLQRLKPKRIRSRSEQQALDEQEENMRRNNFVDAMERVTSLSNEIEEKTIQIQNSMRSEVAALTDDQQYIEGCCLQIKEDLGKLDDEFLLIKDFLHPSQTVLVQMVHLYNQQQVECEDLMKQLALKEGEISALKEMQEQRIEIIESIFDDEQKEQETSKMVANQQYVSNLEQRYTEIMGLYNMKCAEVDQKDDLLSQANTNIDSLNDEKADLEYRLGAVMSSAVSNFETRMKAFNDFGIKSQTFEKVTKLIEDTQINIQQACTDIQGSVDMDLYDIIGDSFDEKQQEDTKAILGNVYHACDYVLDAFEDIAQEFSGVQMFVHPDREMVEMLQCQFIDMHDESIRNKVENLLSTVAVMYRKQLKEQCRAIVPVADRCLADLLVFGFIRSCLALTDFDCISYFPDCLIHLVARWYGQGEAQVLRFGIDFNMNDDSRDKETVSVNAGLIAARELSAAAQEQIPDPPAILRELPDTPSTLSTTESETAV